MPYEFLFYLVTGCFTGLLSGLLGVGGGLIIVPMLSFIFAQLAFPTAYIMPMALATSLAIILITSTTSAYSHQLKNNVNWLVLKRISLGVFIGTSLGSMLVASFDATWLKSLFIVYTFLVASQMLWEVSPRASRQLPSTPLLNLVGAGIGAISSFIGIGGGTLSVPYLIYCNIHPKQAIGTSSAIGVIIALGAILGFGLSALNLQDLPAPSFGFVYLPAFLFIALSSLFTAPIGASWVQKLPVSLLKRLFALLLYAVGVGMWVTL